MLTFAIILAVVLLAFSAFAAFGVPYLVMGPRAFEEFGERPDAQLLAATLLTAAALVAMLPFAGGALISAAPQMQVIAETILGVPERIWS
ncbi:MAG: hypothetical protein FP825_09170 [Hyphomonas sp.]|uniref:hypothetical protein n=1 Tax=Hyphomonas sp. TaxID=87 RepID=UPI0017B7CFD5|nr:hypothetical protein [Hyphomonas sp.]MBA3068639.1 hypothetical protein [Hyphomonas sp.]MBU3921777.1 hypothetical protein [Alphaproteobacteria bacterium]MBU4061958.1 hypothetical protein [Alphaproteobacteria bacterium]MBU4166113.1 hypothetical protein [Alphaproteobacteria bacterium]